MALDPKAFLSKLPSLLSGLAKRLPRRPGKASETGSLEPFSSIEDETPGADLSLEKNAAIAFKRKRERIDLREAAAAFFGNRTALLSTAAVLLVLLLLATAAFIAGRPPKPLPAAAAVDPEGEALVGKFIIPPETVLEPRVELDREPKRVYTEADAARFRTDPAGVDIQALAARNDAAAEALFGTVP